MWWGWRKWKAQGKHNTWGLVRQSKKLESINQTCSRLGFCLGLQCKVCILSPPTAPSDGLVMVVFCHCCPMHTQPKARPSRLMGHQGLPRTTDGITSFHCEMPCCGGGTKQSYLYIMWGLRHHWYHHWIPRWQELLITTILESLDLQRRTRPFYRITASTRPYPSL